jgi:hypothetical protein
MSAIEQYREKPFALTIAQAWVEVKMDFGGPADSLSGPQATALQTTTQFDRRCETRALGRSEARDVMALEAAEACQSEQALRPLQKQSSRRHGVAPGSAGSQQQRHEFRVRKGLGTE